MFEMQYDKNGQPIKQQQPPVEPEPAPEPAPVEQHPEPEIEEPTAQNITTAEEDMVAEASSEAKPVSDKEENFRRLREKAERLERERNEAFALAQELKKKFDKPVQQETSQPEPEQDYTLNPDDLVEGKHLSRYDRELKQLKQKQSQYEQQSIEFRIERQVNAQFPDFGTVVSPKNVMALREKDPDLAEAIAHTPDLYKKAVLTYKMIKQMGIGASEKYSAEREKALKNASKPKSLHAISPQSGSSPLSHANAFAQGLTDDLRKQLLHEMNSARKKM